MKCCRTVRRMHGWSLFHTMIAMPLFLAFMLLSSKLFFAHVNLARDATEQSEAGARMGRAIFYLRLDSWSAEAAEIRDAGATLVLRGAQGETTWRVEDGGLSRIAADEKSAMRYIDLGPLRFSASPGAVVLWIDQTPVSIPLAWTNHASGEGGGP